MKLAKFITFSFLLFLVSGLIGLSMKLIHLEHSNVILGVFVVSNVILAVSSIYELRRSDKFNFNEKAIWTIALIFLSGLAGILYYTIGRKRVTNVENKI